MLRVIGGSKNVNYETDYNQEITNSRDCQKTEGKDSGESIDKSE